MRAVGARLRARRAASSQGTAPGALDRLNWQAPAAGAAYCSTMCSTTSERLARIGTAIDQLAADSLAPDRAGSDASMHKRLASIWAMVTELDPELARRVRKYGTESGA
jgi:hypothetical protein